MKMTKQNSVVQQLEELGWECCKFSKAGPKIQVLQIAWVNIELKHFELKLSNWSISIISRNLLVDNYIISITIA